MNMFTILFVTEIDVEILKKIISTIKQCAKHLFTGQNTQHLGSTSTRVME